MGRRVRTEPFPGLKCYPWAWNRHSRLTSVDRVNIGGSGSVVSIVTGGMYEMDILDATSLGYLSAVGHVPEWSVTDRIRSRRLPLRV